MPEVESNFGSGPLGTPSKGNLSELKEGTKRIRVGPDYQANLPAFIPPGQRRAEHLAERGLRVWAPVKGVEFDTKLEQFIRIAKGTYGYNKEQALGLLFWH